MRGTYNQRMFYAAAIYNWLAAAATIAKSLAPAAIPLDTPFDPFCAQVFGLLVAIYGYGYFLVARDPARNEGIVWMGIVGKLATFALFLAYAIAGRFPLPLMLPAAGDVVFAFLFLQFLFGARARYVEA
jgi:hypothetical protein